MDIKIPFELNSSKRNDPETEREFREVCSIYEIHRYTSNCPLSQDYQKYIDLYHRNTSLYLICRNKNAAKLIIYDTENEKEEERILNTPELLDKETCIVPLPSGELFCFGNKSAGMQIPNTFIIDKNYQAWVIPSGTPCGFSTGIYFNSSVFCFGEVIIIVVY